MNSQLETLKQIALKAGDIVKKGKNYAKKK